MLGFPKGNIWVSGPFCFSWGGYFSVLNGACHCGQVFWNQGGDWCQGESNHPVCGLLNLPVSTPCRTSAFFFLWWLSCVLFILSQSKNLWEFPRRFITSHPTVAQGLAVSESLSLPKLHHPCHRSACSGLWCCFHCPGGARGFAQTKVKFCVSRRGDVINN